ncbi:protein NSP-INTERACTING KINASE 1 [Daucus carota subsp. sativus]|uniref:protein NSP-INTERACTING KINASE 1 n=1 Tax=Daucus carota subsp. sativus TaxID=79200 RepID=UPI0007F0237B|nr:PREDICTED: protein NSP-INTERACTING KINASE 1-like [Daucus carota subsp. sativus]XP_017231391.1 PREDICTED: protein NSP-INTERACTING KINASE 1-like [Daucus carota subsp. sativus]
MSDRGNIFLYLRGSSECILPLSYVFCFVIYLSLWTSVNSLLTAKGVNLEVQALMSIKAALKDPHGVLAKWDSDAADPCSWTMVTCSPDYLVVGLGTPSQTLSGILSPSIGNLTNLQTVQVLNRKFICRGTSSQSLSGK